MGFLSPMRNIVSAARGAVQRAPIRSTANDVANNVAGVVNKAGLLGRRLTGFKKGGEVSSGRGNGIAVRGKTKCKMY